MSVYDLTVYDILAGDIVIFQLCFVFDRLGIHGAIWFQGGGRRKGLKRGTRTSSVVCRT